MTIIIAPSADAFEMPPLVTAEAFAEWTQGKIEAADPRVEPLLKGASAGIRRWCGWHIAPVLEETLVGDGPGSYRAVLPTKRLRDVLEIRNAGHLVDVTQVDFSAHGIIDWRGGHFTDRLGQLQVLVRHGYDLTEVEDVAQVVRQVVANALASPMGATREQAGAVSISWATTAPGVSGGLSLLQRDLDVLAPFRI